MNLNPTQKAVVYILIGLALASIYFGSYLPLKKARLYPSAALLLNQVRGVDGFTMLFTKVFDTYSPVGQEEVVKFTSSIVINTITREDVPLEPAKAVVEFIEPYMMKNNVRHLIMLANMYGNLWIRFGTEEDFFTAEKYYRAAQAIGPKLPPVLYSLLDLYRRKGDVEKVKETGKIILAHWPQDGDVRRLLTEIEKK